MGNATIAVCAAEETIRERIEAALALGGYESAATSSSLEELIDGAQETRPALVVLVCALERFVLGAELSALRAQLGDTPVIVVATGLLGAVRRKLLHTGVDGLVPEAQIDNALVPTIDAVLAAQLCVPASMRGTLARPVLSHREKQVLELALEGATNSEIAARLFVSESTVKSHLASTFRKLGVSSRAEAATSVLAPDSGLELRTLSLVDRGALPSAI